MRAYTQWKSDKTYEPNIASVTCYAVATKRLNLN